MKTPSGVPAVWPAANATAPDAGALADPNSPLAKLLRTAREEDLNWDGVRHRARQVGANGNDAWALIALERCLAARQTPTHDSQGCPFFLRNTDTGLAILRFIDVHLGGVAASATTELSQASERHRWLWWSLRAEAIDSSLLEGAVATRAEAEAMLRDGRAPRTPGERMVFNNFHALKLVREAKDRPLTIDFLLELQDRLTDRTLAQADGGGRLRRPNEKIAVYDIEDGQVVHEPPHAETLPARLQRLCDFANAPEDPKQFLHPAQKAALLHFQLGYDHPFIDGNGRTARAIFYWSMLRSGYWLVEHLAISTIIRGQPKQYARAYLNSEQPGKMN